MANSDVLCNSPNYVNRQPQAPPKEGQSCDTTSFIGSSSTEEKDATDGLSCLREAMETKGIPHEAKEIIFKSWRKGTTKQYGTYLKKWIQFCCERQISRTEVTVNNTLEFLTSLFNSGSKSSAINTARCALSCLDFDNRSTIGTHPLITRFMKGVYESRPVQCRYSAVWDVKDILDMFRNWNANDKLSLKDLSLKTVTLMALVSAERVQSLHSLNTVNMVQHDKSITFPLGIIKQSRPSVKSKVIELHEYPKDEKLCVVKTINCYIDRTAHLRGDETKLFITHAKPYHAASADTLRRWIKSCMSQANVNTDMFSAQ